MLYSSTSPQFKEIALLLNQEATVVDTGMVLSVCHKTITKIAPTQVRRQNFAQPRSLRTESIDKWLEFFAQCRFTKPIHDQNNNPHTLSGRYKQTI